MFKTKLLSTLALALTFTSAANAELPNEEKYSFLDEITRTLDLTAPNVTLGASSGGTSVYAVYTVNGKAVGAILPENAATKISGEIITFYIARAVGADHLYSPAIYHRLTGANLAAFKKMIPRTPYRSRLKEQNRVNLLAQLAKSPSGIDTVYKHWGKKPEAYDNLVSVRSNSFNASHVLKGSRNALGSMLKCSGPRPSSSTTVSINGGTSTEFELAREMSTIFLIDALSQQWDRFSGGNLQTINVGGVAHFAAYDNGGTWGGTRWTEKFLNLVSRFDRNVAQEILEMDNFIKNGGNYAGLRSEAELQKALGVEHFPKAMSNFKASLSLVAKHIRKNDGCYF